MLYTIVNGVVVLVSTKNRVRHAITVQHLTK